MSETKCVQGVLLERGSIPHARYQVRLDRVHLPAKGCAGVEDGEGGYHCWLY